MKQRKIPMRTCVVTREKYPKNELIRVVRTPEGNVLVDKSGKQNGKGAYLKLDEAVINKARQSKVLERTLETVVHDNIYEELLGLINS